MKKLFASFLCVCFLLSTSLALTTDSFSIKLPDDFYVVEETEDSGIYTNGKMEVTYTIKQSEPGSFYKSVSEIKDEMDSPWSGLLFRLLGFSEDSQIIEINNKEFLKDIEEYDESKSINYLASTAKKLTVIKFSGENLDEAQVNSIISSIKLKGMSVATYDFLLNAGFYGVLIAIFVGIYMIKRFIISKATAKKGNVEDEFEVESTQADLFNEKKSDDFGDDYQKSVEDEWKL